MRHTKMGVTECCTALQMDVFSKLPDELILKIFGHLEHSELIQCLSVCRTWYRLGHDDSLWHEIRTTWYRLLNDRHLLSSIASQHPNVHSLVVVLRSFFGTGRGSSPVPVINSDVWKRFRKLAKLTLSECPVMFFDRAIPQILSTCHKTLISFSCEGSVDLKSEQFQLLFSHPSVQYRELSLAHCPLIGDLAIFQAQQDTHFSTCLEKLEVLNIDGVGTLERLTDAAMIVLLTACPLLKSLSCDGETMTDECSKHIQNLSRLKQLSISFCTELTDKSLECFSKLRSLTSLYLRKGNEFTNQGFELLFDGLCSSDCDGSRNKIETGKLRKLCLIECKLLRDSGLIKLAERFPHLVHLDLSWCWNLSDIGLEAVTRHCQEIETLKFVGLKNAMCVPVLSTSLPRLRYLDLQQTDLVDDEAMSKLKEAKPWIKIVNYYGDEVVL